MADPSAEGSLVARIQAGERNAEDDLVRRYQRGVAVIVRYSAGDPSLVDDFCQETFRLAIQKIRAGEVREPDKLSGFICSLARNLVIGHFRKKARTDQISVPLPAAGPDPLERLIAAERTELVREVLREMPLPRDREILYRFYVAEEDKRDICAALDVTSLQFNRIIDRARKRFRDLYHERLEQRRDQARSRG